MKASTAEDTCPCIFGNVASHCLAQVVTVRDDSRYPQSRDLRSFVFCTGYRTLASARNGRGVRHHCIEDGGQESMICANPMEGLSWPSPADEGMAASETVGTR